MINIKIRKSYSFLNPVKRLCLHGASIAMVLAAVFFMFSSPASANPTNKGLEAAAGVGFSGNPPIQDVPSAIGSMVGLALSFVGLAFFILMIYGGFIWMFARGNDQDVQKAKDLIQAAIIGLIIVMMAYAITMFIGNALTGSGEVGSGTVYEARVTP